MKKLLFLTATLLFLNAQLSAQCLPQRHYPFKNLSGIDVIGNQNASLSPLAGFITQANRFGIANSAVYQIQPNNYQILFPHLTTSQVSVSMWITPNWSPTAYRVLIGTNSGNVPLLVEPNTRILGIYTSNGFLSSGVALPTLTSEYVHVVWTADGATNQIFLNGQLIFTTTQGVDPSVNPITKLLNNSTINANQGYVGAIHDVFTFNRVLSLDEVRFHRGFTRLLGASPYHLSPSCANESILLESTLHHSLPGVTYQWYKNGISIPGAQSTSYSTLSTLNSATDTFKLVATMGCLTQETPNFIIETASETAPIISQNLLDNALCENGYGFLGVVTTGINNTFSWTKNGAPIVNSTPSLTINSALPNMAGSYQITISNTCGTAISNVGLVTVNPPSIVEIVTQPISESACLGDEISFLSEFAGGTITNYQWQLNGQNISGETSNTISIDPISTGNLGNYQLIGTTFEDCQLISDPAVLSTQSITNYYPITLNNTNDVISGNHATNVAGLAADNGIYGNTNGALFSNSSFGRYLDIADITANQLTVSMWIKRSNTSPTTGLTVLISSDNTALPLHLVIDNIDGRLGFFNGALYKGTGAVLPNSSFWRHVVWSTNGSSTKIYLDGVEVLNTASAPINPNIVPVSRFINAANSAGQGLLGTVDEISVVRNYVNDLEVAILRGFSNAASTQNVICQGTAFSHTINLRSTVNDALVTYTWFKDGVAIAGQTSRTLNLASVQATDAGEYRLQAQVGCITSLSEPLTLTVSNNMVPVITVQPTAGSQCVGTNFELSVTAIGGGVPLYYFWNKNGSSISGANNSTLVLNNLSIADAGTYTVDVTNYVCGFTTSIPVVLSIAAPVVIATQPINQTICTGQTTNLSVSATGTGLSYQWQKNGTNVSGATSATLNIANTLVSDAGNYTVVITGTCGNVTSTTAVVTVNTAPTISALPSNTTLCEGAAFNASPTIGGTVSAMQWNFNGNPIAGATANTFSIPSASVANNGNYTLALTSTCGNTTSSPIALTVNPSTAITIQPIGATICTGQTTNLSVSATGAGLNYQWQKNGTNISGATNATLNIASALVSDAGNYTVIITGTCGNVTSTTAVVTVNTAPTISALPSNTTLCEGAAFNASPTIGGTVSAMQWNFNGNPIAGATASTFSIPSASVANNGNYTLALTSTCGNTTSSPIALTVNPSTAITTQPIGATICTGQTTNLSVSATGAGLNYQWQKNGTNVSGATSATLNIANALLSDAGNYTVVITGTCGNVTSTTAVVTVNSVPTFTTTLSDANYCYGETVVLEATATNNPTSYEWIVDGVLSGTTNSLTIPSISASTDGFYVLYAINGCGQSFTFATIGSNPTYANNLQQVICNGDIFVFNGQSLSQSGIYQANLASIDGCDSTSTLSLTVLTAIENNISATICGGQSITLGTQTLTATGNYQEVFTNTSGCDSTVNLSLTVIDASTVFNENVSVCYGQNYQFGTQTLSTNGVYSQTFVSSAGCDSNVVVSFTVEDEINTTITVIENTISVAVTPGASYQWIDCATETPIVGATSSSFSPTISGNYAVEVSLNNCLNTSICSTIDLLHTDEKWLLETIHLYPNPTSEYFFIENLPEESDIRLSDISGKIVHIQSGGQSLAKIDIQTLENGTYVVHIDYKGNRVNKKLVVFN